MMTSGDALAASTRAGRAEASFANHYVSALALGLVGYAALGRGFAYLGVAPLYVGEVLYLLGLLALVQTGCAVATLAAMPNLVLLLLAAWTLARTLPFLPIYGMDALRDAVVILYGGFSFIVCALLVQRPERLHQGVRMYGRFAAAYGALAGLIYVAQAPLAAHGLLPTWPNSGALLLDLKPGDVAVHLSGAATFAVLFFRRVSWPWVMLLVAGMAVVGVENRGGLLAIILPLSVALAAAGRGRQLSGVLAFGATVLAAAWLLDLNVSLTDRDRPLSVEQIFLNVLSIFGAAGHGDLDSTKEWRLLWWQAIEGYTLHGPYFWSGKGFGIGLAAADGFSGVTAPGTPELRSPHNVNMTILARAGVPGLLLWFLLLLSWFRMMARNLMIAHARSETAWSRLFLFIACYVAALFINSCFDVALEGPMSGIWFWVLFGLGVGAALIYRTHRGTFTPVHSPRRRTTTAAGEAVAPPSCSAP